MLVKHLGYPAVLLTPSCYINIIRLLSISRLKTENSLLQSDLPVAGWWSFTGWMLFQGRKFSKEIKTYHFCLY